MVARNGEYAILGNQFFQRPHIGSAGCWRAISQVASNHCHIWIQGIGLGDDPFHPGRLQQSAGMQISQLNDLKAVKFLRQAR